MMASVIGTISHEYGHYVIAKAYGYDARINYAKTYWTPKNDEIVSAEKSFYITLGGPLQTMLTGTIGLVLLYIFRGRFHKKDRLSLIQWILVFLSLFWLRQTANLCVWLSRGLWKGEFSTSEDEIRMAEYLGLPYWSITALTGLIGAIVLAMVIFKVIPAKQRLTIVLAGLAGGMTGYILWLILLGKYVMP